MVKKTKAVELKFKAVSTSHILRTLLENDALDNVILSEPTNLRRIVNRTRASKVQKIKQTCFLFLIFPTYPNILKWWYTIWFGWKRKTHLIFATKKQLRLLRPTKSWYFDGTSRLVKKPMMQLWTIHGFLKVWNAPKKRYELKQVRAFALCSNEQTDSGG